jgi:hypothetical protein
MSNKTIAVITNTFGKYHRQNVAMQSLLNLKQKFPDNVYLFNLQFKDEEETFDAHYEGIDTVHVLECSSESYIKNSEKKLPVISEIICKGFIISKCDYVVFVNSDVILLPGLIEKILKEEPDCMAGPRLEIEEINSFQDVLDENVKPIRTEIAGYDYFVFENKWFSKYKKHFISKFVIGKPFFDVVIAGLMVIFGEKCIISNSYPMFALHMFHGNAAVTSECPEKKHNEDIFRKNHLFRIADNIIYFNLQYNLCKRKPWGAFLQPQENEQQIQKTFFDAMNIHLDNQIKYIE